MKLLFLDVDGVLALPGNWGKKRNDILLPSGKTSYPLNKNRTTNLFRIVTETKCEVVLSSSWRVFYDKADMEHILSIHGCPILLHGYTLRCSSERGIEIREYLRQHPTDQFVIIDDEINDISPYFKQNKIVQCSGIKGLDVKQTNRAIQILNGII